MYCATFRGGSVVLGRLIFAVLLAVLVLNAGCRHDDDGEIVIIPTVRGAWSAGPDLPAARVGAAAVALNGSIYMIGGMVQGATRLVATDELLEFDPAAGSYTPRTGMNTPRYNFAACVSGGKIYVFGGCSHLEPLILDSAEVYDPGLNTWTPVADMPLPRYEHVSGACGGKIWINGGGTYGGFSTNTTWCYDPDGDSWTGGAIPSEYAEMPTSRRSTCGVSFNDLLWIACGVDSGACALAALEAYDHSTDSWHAYPEAPTERYGCACAILDGKIFVMGGGELPDG
jgi:hypothetical protein